MQEILDTEDVQSIQVSCYSEEGVMDLKNKACDALLAHRVDAKLKGSKINSIINRIHVAQPKARDDLVRAPFIPEAAKERKKFDKNDPERRRLQRDVELEEGGAGVFNINLKRSFGFYLFYVNADRYLQRIIYLLIPSGRWISSQKSWTARILPISSTPILRRSWRPLSVRRRNLRQKASTTVEKTW